MAEETKAAEAKAPTSKTIKDSVAEKIAASGSTVMQMVVDKMATEVINDRAVILEKAVLKVKSISGELNRLRADNVTYNEDGSKKEESWSKSQVESRKKKVKELQALNKLVDRAMADEATADDWNKLKGKVLILIAPKTSIKIYRTRD